MIKEQVYRIQNLRLEDFSQLRLFHLHPILQRYCVDQFLHPWMIVLMKRKMVLIAGKSKIDSLLLRMKIWNTKIV